VRAFVGPDAAGAVSLRRDGGEQPGARAALPGGERERLRHHVDGRPGIALQHPGGTPRGEQLGGVPVLVAPRGFRQHHVHDIVLVAGGERGPLVGRDHVVRRSDQARQPLCRAVAFAPKRRHEGWLRGHVIQSR
jgi:hypothetical protein